MICSRDCRSLRIQERLFSVWQPHEGSQQRDVVCTEMLLFCRCQMQVWKPIPQPPAWLQRVMEHVGTLQRLVLRQTTQLGAVLRSDRVDNLILLHFWADRVVNTFLSLSSSCESNPTSLWHSLCSWPQHPCPHLCRSLSWERDFPQGTGQGGMA